MNDESRIARLESNIRILIFGVALVVVAVAVLATVSIIRVSREFESLMSAQAAGNEEYFRSLRVDLEVAELALEKQIAERLEDGVSQAVFKASEFHVVDDRGKSLIVLGTTPTGGTFGIHNHAGQLRVALGVTTDDHGLVAILDDRGELKTQWP